MVTSRLLMLVGMICLACSAAGCIGLLAFDPGVETVVVNETPVPVVVEVIDSVNARYFPVEPGMSVVVDTVGEVNSPPERLAVRDQLCSVGLPIEADFSHGGIVTVGSALPPTFAPGRRGSGVYPEHSGFSTCELAAATIR
jgi:hypothetical protein